MTKLPNFCRDEQGHESVREPSPQPSFVEPDRQLHPVEEESSENSSEADGVKRRNELIGMPVDVALLRYVESIASSDGIRHRYQVFVNKI